jgi:hypothetical protein
VARKIVQNLLALCGMNLVGVSEPYGRGQRCVSPPERADSGGRYVIRAM